MPALDLFEIASGVSQVKEELDHLIQKQVDALRSATYLEMTPDEAREYDERRVEITKLIQEPVILQKFGRFSTGLTHGPDECFYAKGRKSSNRGGSRSLFCMHRLPLTCEGQSTNRPRLV
jgi:hypothetical protein